MCSQISLLVLLMASQWLGAETVFEGYYKLVRNNLHIGFTVERIDIAPDTKIKTITYFTRTFEADPPTNKAIGVLKQSPSGSPLELKFEGSEDDAKTHHQKNFAANKDSQEMKDVFFNTALPNITLLNHPQKGKTYTYHAVKESTNRILQGEVKLLDTKSVNTKAIHRLLSDYDGFPMEWWVTDDGQVLFTRDVERAITSTLVPSADEAIGKHVFNRGELSKWFNEIPSGQKNPVALGQIKFDPGLFSAKIDTQFIFVPDAIPLRLSDTSAAKK